MSGLGHGGMTDVERDVRREYGSVRRAEWAALNEWAASLTDLELLAICNLRIPGDAGIAADSEARRRGLPGRSHRGSTQSVPRL